MSAVHILNQPNMDSTDETIIELSKTKLVLLILVSCGFVAAGAWMLSLDPAEIRASRSFTFFYNDPTYVHVLGAAALLFFGFCGLYGLKKMFDKKPGLVLNSAGIVDNASAVAAGFIPWSEVVGADVFEIQKQKMLVIGLRDPGKYIGGGGALRRMVNKANQGMTGSPVSIPATTLKIDFAELLSLFDRYLQKYGAGRDEAAAAPESLAR